MAKRHKDAQTAQSGACNPTQMAKALYDACMEVHAEGGVPREDAAVRLIAHQLSYILVTFDQILLERQVNNLQEEVKALEKQNQRFKSCSIKGLSRGPLSRDHYVINGAKTFVKKYSIKRMRAQGKKLTTQCIEEHYNTLEPDYQEWCEQEGDLLGYEPAFDLEKDSDFDDFIAWEYDSDYLQTLGGYEKEQQEEYDTYLDWDQLWYDDL